MGANVDGISQQMAQEATKLDQHAAQLRAEAGQHLIDKQQEADEYMAKARRLAEEMVANAQREAAELLAKADNHAEGLKQQAEQAKEDAAHWRKTATEQRKRAKLPSLPQQPPTPDGQTRQDGQPTHWTGPDNRVWDLTLLYADPSGAAWLWAGRYEADGNVTWPVMTRDDYRELELQLPKCPPLTPTPDSSGDVRVATGDPETAVMPAIPADQNGSQAC